MIEQLALIANAHTERRRRIAYFEDHHPEYLSFVRSIAREIARRDGDVDIDRVHEELDRQNLPTPDEFGADNRLLGALFYKREFQAIGSHLTSRTERVARAGRGSSIICVYRLRDVA